MFKVAYTGISLELDSTKRALAWEPVKKETTQVKWKRSKRIMEKGNSKQKVAGKWRKGKH